MLDRTLLVSAGGGSLQRSYRLADKFIEAESKMTEMSKTTIITTSTS